MELNSIILVENCGKMSIAQCQLNISCVTVGKRSPTFRLCDKPTYVALYPTRVLIFPFKSNMSSTAGY